MESQESLHKKEAKGDLSTERGDMRMEARSLSDVLGMH